MRKTHKIVALLAIAASAAWTSAAPAQKPADPAKTGIEVGAKAPDFTLKGQDGVEHSLQDLLKSSPKTALVFYRSASW